MSPITRASTSIGARDDLYNDLPAVSFDAGTVIAFGADDSIADEAGGILAGQKTVSARAFDLRPVTDNRPAFYAILRLNQLSLLLARLQILPQAEIGALVNLAVLAQAAFIAFLVLLVPLAAPKTHAPSPTGMLRPMLYFPALALGFLFLEIFGIEKASAFLDDRATGFAIVLSTMLVFSGLGSFLSERFSRTPGRAVWRCGGGDRYCGPRRCSCCPARRGWRGHLPFFARVTLVVAVMAPVSVAMGMPFPLGLAQGEQKFFLAWAWGLNGAFSVVATPLANLVLRNSGLHAVLGAAVMLYAGCGNEFSSAKETIGLAHCNETLSRRGLIGGHGCPGGHAGFWPIRQRPSRPPRCWPRRPRRTASPGIRPLSRPRWRPPADPSR